mmetsp:Transcript_4024/g.11262  ORF Transcript_4024/g.11262 Transcript_4024/m.11262 type:complete len:210 (-) Transcript_4024:472-1101(-)
MYVPSEQRSTGFMVKCHDSTQNPKATFVQSVADQWLVRAVRQLYPAVPQLHSAVCLPRLEIVHPLAQWRDSSHIPLSSNMSVGDTVVLVGVFTVGLHELPSCSIEKLEVVIFCFTVSQPEGCTGCPEELLAAQPRTLDETVTPMWPVVAKVPLGIAPSNSDLSLVLELYFQVWSVENSISALASGQPGEDVLVLKINLELDFRSRKLGD